MGVDLLGYEKNGYYKVDDVNTSSTFGQPIDAAGRLTERKGPYMQQEGLKYDRMTKAHPGSVNFPRRRRPE